MPPVIARDDTRFAIRDAGGNPIRWRMIGTRHPFGDAATLCFLAAIEFWGAKP
jgi:hypothetical protein